MINPKLPKARVKSGESESLSYFHHRPNQRKLIKTNFRKISIVLNIAIKKYTTQDI